MRDENDDIFKGYQDAKEYFWVRLIKLDEDQAWNEAAVIEGKVHHVSKRTLTLFPVSCERRLIVTCHATEMPEAGDEYKVGFVKRLEEICPVSQYFVAFRFANTYERAITKRNAASEEAGCIRKAAGEKDLSGFVVSADATQTFVFNGGSAELGDEFGVKKKELTPF